MDLTSTFSCEFHAGNAETAKDGSFLSARYAALRALRVKFFYWRCNGTGWIIVNKNTKKMEFGLYFQAGA